MKGEFYSRETLVNQIIIPSWQNAIMTTLGSHYKMYNNKPRRVQSRWNTESLK